MSKYAALLEDEDDILGGTPQTKFWDMLTTAHADTSKAVIDEITTNYAILEHIVKQTIKEEKLNEYLEFYYEDNKSEITEDKKSLYLEFVGKVVSRMPQ
jgi:hypothetical protein